MEMVSSKDLLKIHEYILNADGGIPGIRDKTLMMSALERPYTTVFGMEVYETNEEKIAVITHSIIAYHVFVDGNKRTGIQTLTVMCDLNDIQLEYTDDELINLALSIATGNSDVQDIASWIVNHEV